MAEKKKNAPVEYYPSALTIAGSDSCGGAGIGADLRTFNALGVYGCAAVTAVTAQSPLGVSRVDLIPGTGVTAQIEAVANTVALRCVKTGMLGSAENVHAVAEAVKKFKLKMICDPVIVSTSGKMLLDDEGFELMQKELLPLALWITPNIPEAERLLGKKITSNEGLPQAALALAEKFRTNVLLKGGHDEKSKHAVDHVCYKGDLFTLSTPKIKLPPYAGHGTGCSLSAAMTAMTALDFSWSDMLQDAKAFVFGSLRENVEIGEGINAMYPPVDDALEFVEMIRIGGKKGKGGSR